MDEDYLDVKPDLVKLESEFILDDDIENDTDLRASDAEDSHHTQNARFVESNPVSPERIYLNMAYGLPSEPESASSMSQDVMNEAVKIKEEITDNGTPSPDLPPNYECKASAQTILSTCRETSSCFSVEKTSVKAEDGLTKGNIIRKEACFKCCVGKAHNKIASSSQLQQCSSFSECLPNLESPVILPHTASAVSVHSNCSAKRTSQDYGEAVSNEEISMKHCKAEFKSSAAHQEQTPSQSNWPPFYFADTSVIIKEEVVSDSDNCVDENSESDDRQMKTPPPTSSLTKSSSSPNMRNFACIKCAAQFQTKYSLRKHLLNHCELRPFSCDQCSARFKRSGDLKCHSKSHRNKKALTCDQCSAQFNRGSNLKMHLLIHSNERRFFCNQCSAQFKRKANLKQHLLIHSNEKAFTCNQCSAQFNRNDDLRSHLIVHSDIKPFTCDQCSAQFKRKGVLKQHLLTHSNKKAFGCDQCSAQFKQRRSLRRHVLIHSDALSSSSH